MHDDGQWARSKRALCCSAFVVLIVAGSATLSTTCTTRGCTRGGILLAQELGVKTNNVEKNGVSPDNGKLGSVQELGGQPAGRQRKAPQAIGSALTEYYDLR